jgi:hypothetical protein
VDIEQDAVVAAVHVAPAGIREALDGLFDQKENGILRQNCTPPQILLLPAAKKAAAAGGRRQSQHHVWERARTIEGQVVALAVAAAHSQCTCWSTKISVDSQFLDRDNKAG